MNILQLKIKCPACTAEFPLERGTTDKRVFEIAAYAAVFGAAWPLVESYLACFRTEKGRGMRPERMVVILKELSEIYKNSKMAFRGKEVVVHQVVLRRALKDIGQRSDNLYGFKDHNYLKKVLESEMNKWHHARALEEKKRIEFEMTNQGRKKEERPAPAVREVVDSVAKSLPAGGQGKVAKVEKPRNKSQKSFTEQCKDLAARQGINLNADKTGA